MLLAELIKAKVNIVKPFAKFLSRKHLNDIVEVSNVTKKHRNLALVISDNALTLPNTLSNKRWHIDQLMTKVVHIVAIHGKTRKGCYSFEMSNKFFAIYASKFELTKLTFIASTIETSKMTNLTYIP